MAYKNLLVHLDDTEACDSRIAAAITLAGAHDAYLAGLSLAAETSMPSYIGGQLPPEVLDLQHQMAGERAQAAKARFESALELSGRPGACRVESCLDIDVASMVAMHARHADLAVLGQADPEAPQAGGRHMLEDVVLSCGRPALVVPYVGAGKTIGRRVMVAWDAGRESARAVNDALPLLTAAAEVVVLSINPRPGRDRHGEEPGADIALHLARHGVKVEVAHTQVQDIGIGEALLSRLADAGSDLLVMGAYGHSRLREVVLGGVTRTILEHMTVPVLMSH